jgi:hypothetical protein
MHIVRNVGVCALSVLAAGLAIVAIYFLVLPVFSIIGWGWWAWLLTVASWVASVVLAATAFFVGVVAFAIYVEAS